MLLGVGLLHNYNNNHIIMHQYNKKLIVVAMKTETNLKMIRGVEYCIRKIERIISRFVCSALAKTFHFDIILAKLL